jgi:Na+-translocating ferredoxin:NAD+ oxidoreductase subunit D
MQKRKFTLAIAPHINTQEDVSKTMLLVIYALLPALGWGFYIFGLPAFWLTATCIIGAVSAEMLMQYMRKRDIWVVKDLSAVLTGILLAMTLSPLLPLWAGFLGSWFAIIIGKALFGGLGYNIFNPALLGRAFLAISFPLLMTNWTVPIINTDLSAVTTATPLALSKFEHIFTSLQTLFFGMHGGCLGETSALFLLLGGLFLVYKKVIDFRVPVSIFTAVAVMTVVLNFFTQGQAGTIFYNVFAGGLMLGAFFMATDLVTSPVTPFGNIIFGLGIGIIVMVIRVLGGLPEGVMFAILFMNGLVPLINRHTWPRRLGQGVVNK